MLDTEGFSLPRTHTSHGCLHKIKPVTIAAEMRSCRGGIGTGPTLTVDLLAGDNRWEKRNHFFFNLAAFSCTGAGLTTCRGKVCANWIGE